jgi:hypothetical protein
MSVYLRSSASSRVRFGAFWSGDKEKEAWHRQTIVMLSLSNPAALSFALRTSPNTLRCQLLQSWMSPWSCDRATREADAEIAKWLAAGKDYTQFRGYPR